MYLLKQLLIFPIRIYQWFISPLLPSSCRHQPSCSEYMAQAIQQWGALKGLIIGLRRLARCHPFGTHGYDPVPENKNRHLSKPAPCKGRHKN